MYGFFGEADTVLLPDALRAWAVAIELTNYVQIRDERIVRVAGFPGPSLAAPTALE